MIKESPGATPMASALASIVERGPVIAQFATRADVLIGAVTGAYAAMRDAGSGDAGQAAAVLGAVGGATATADRRSCRSGSPRWGSREYLRLDRGRSRPRRGISSTGAGASGAVPRRPEGRPRALRAGISARRAGPGDFGVFRSSIDPEVVTRDGPVRRGWVGVAVRDGRDDRMRWAKRSVEPSRPADSTEALEDPGETAAARPGVALTRLISLARLTPARPWRSR